MKITRDMPPRPRPFGDTAQLGVHVGAGFHPWRGPRSTFSHDRPRALRGGGR